MTDMLIVVDMQNDFITGSLGSAQAQAIVDSVCQTIKAFQGPVLYTMDTHDKEYLKSQEGQHLPIMHCQEGTSGWQIEEKVYQALLEKDAKRLLKSTFASLDLMEEIRLAAPSRVTFVGICTDICVISNALMAKARFPELPITVIASACAGSSPQKHQAALEVLKSCQVNLIV